MQIFAIVVPIIVAVSILLFVIVRCVKNTRVSLERRAYLEGTKIPDKYCCEVRMRLISLDCHYSGGKTKEYYVCYICQQQIEYERPAELYSGQKEGDSIWSQVEKGQHQMYETYRWGGFSGNRRR